MENNGGGNRAEALRWLSIAEKLLAARDFYGTRSFAIRARESDPIVLEAADRVIAVADTLLAAEGRINNQYDWYSILQISQPTQSIELIATQYRRLALLLHPEANRVAFADHAFRLVSDAWCVLSNPLRKALYDNDYLMCSPGTTESSQKPKSPPHQPQFPQPVRTSPRKETRITVEESQQQEQPPPTPPPERSEPSPSPPPAQPQPQPPQSSPHRSQHQEDPQQQQQQFVKENPKSTNVKVSVAEERPNVSDLPESTQETTQQHIDSNRPSRVAESTRPTESSIPGFWTACPYCYNLYEYPKGYEDCVLRCQNCAKAFQAAVIPSPPVADNASTFCCWGFFPLGVSPNARGTTGSAAWSPFSAIFACPLPGQGGTKSGKSRNVKPAKKSTPRFFCDEDDIYVEVSEPSDSSDEEWGRVSNKKKRSKRGLASRNDKRSHSESLQKGNQGNVGNGNADEVENMNGLMRFGLSNSIKVEPSKKAVATAGVTGKKHKGKGPKELGKLDLNVEFSNEVEEPATGVSEGHGVDNIEGIGFFEGLDEFLNSLPILNAVADDKVKAS
ncbi:uncharacterized protein LOC111793459 [Cucurbita pepo subsp. pepo]|uniref:uncharacterized protein LOC111793459 n=1 Tax=Cucurbita pepo subsp. pepo TaxID=3664 RepID=UPI000C9D8141|nr:uncharacterized protein LOC111793459 [Cucurbita pepo subsp. pepo]